MNLDGTAPTDNPLYNAGNGINSQDYIYAYGFRNPFGGAWRASDGKHYEVENGNALDRLARVDRGGNYDWNGSDASLLAGCPVRLESGPCTGEHHVRPAGNVRRQPVPRIETRSCVRQRIGADLRRWDSKSTGKRILEFELDANGNVVGTPTALVEYVGTGRATVAGLIAGPDGLYFTELYKDQDVVTPIDAGARVFRVRFAPAGNGDFNGDSKRRRGRLRRLAKDVRDAPACRRIPAPMVMATAASIKTTTTYGEPTSVDPSAQAPEQ